MTKAPTQSHKPARPEPAAPTAAAKPARKPVLQRDLVEQIVIAFILAFLVRGFEAEAFVIPTGSMAPTLMGMHKDVTCPQCGFEFTINAADESSMIVRVNGREENLGLVRSGICANCRSNVPVEDQPTFNGDRILVMKFLYNLPFLAKENPKRWEVIVFHYPEEPEVNYIKRMVGLPGETLRLRHGDVLTRPEGRDDLPFTLQRKPLRHQEAMQIHVWDDRHPARMLAESPEWTRWRSNPASAWKVLGTGRYTTQPASTWSELRYHHLVPDHAQWEAILASEPLPYPPFPRLISDFSAYNSGSAATRQLADIIPPHWVGDLTIKGRFETRSNSGTIRLELIEAGVSNRCAIDIATGTATLFHGDEPLGEPAQTAFRGPGAHELAFANVDGRLTLWVDGQTPFGEGRVYQNGEDGYAAPTAEDLQPVRIGVRQADLEVSNLVLTRDLYYTLDPRPPHWDYAGLLPHGTTLSNPEEFEAINHLKWADFPISQGHYLMLGDNSPRSKDSRAWGRRDQAWDDNPRESWEVPENLLVGKAFYVYWPHGKPIWPNLGFDRNVRFPFRPNFERMQWIR